MEPLSVDALVTAARWLRATNSAGETVPAHALVKPVGSDTADVYEADKPDADGQFVFVWGIQETPDGFVGAMTNDFPAYALYDAADGVPAVGETWGAGSGTFKLKKGKAGFRIVGDPDTTLEIVPVVRDRARDLFPSRLTAVNGSGVWKFIRLRLDSAGAEENDGSETADYCAYAYAIDDATTATVSPYVGMRVMMWAEDVASATITGGLQYGFVPLADVLFGYPTAQDADGGEWKWQRQGAGASGWYNAGSVTSGFEAIPTIPIPDVVVSDSALQFRTLFYPSGHPSYRVMVSPMPLVTAGGSDGNPFNGVTDDLMVPTGSGQILIACQDITIAGTWLVIAEISAMVEPDGDTPVTIGGYLTGWLGTENSGGTETTRSETTIVHYPPYNVSSLAYEGYTAGSGTMIAAITTPSQLPVKVKIGIERQFGGTMPVRILSYHLKLIQVAGIMEMATVDCDLPTEPGSGGGSGAGDEYFFDMGEEVTATFSGGTGDCDCLDALVATLARTDPTRWDSGFVFDASGCPAGTATENVGLTFTGDGWRLLGLYDGYDCTFISQDEGTKTVVITVIAEVGVGQSVCTGTFIVTFQGS